MKKAWIYFFLGTTVYAEVKDLGVYGTTFPVLERNIITVLKEKMRSEKGESLLSLLAEKHKKIAETKQYIPKAVHGLTPTQIYKSYTFDPSVSLSQDVSDHNGHVFYKAGTVLNPLDHITLSKEYVFIDGDRPKQLAWAKKLRDAKKVMIILVSGDPIKLMKDHAMEVFFDQEGAMTQRFQLTHVPCVMAQEGQLLRITEIPEEEFSS